MNIEHRRRKYIFIHRFFVRFYSDKEENICRMAAHLQFNGYTINFCGYSEVYRNYLCIAETVISPGNEPPDRLCVDMQLIADRMNVEFDGWETKY